jgi:predicted metalloprotease with PDZ domain
VDLKRFFKRYIHGTEDLPLADLLAECGIAYNTTKSDKVSLGVRLGKEGANSKIAAVYEGGVAHAAGLSAGDVFVAIDGLRVPANGPEGLLSRYKKGDTVTIHVFRRDELMVFQAKLKPDTAVPVSLSVVEKPAAKVQSRKAWLAA